MTTARAIANAAGLIVVAGLLGYGFGRYATPAKVETKVVELTSTKTEWQSRDVEKRVEGPVRIVTVTKSAPVACTNQIETTTTVTEDRGQVVIDRVSDDSGAEIATTSTETTKTVTTDQPRLMLQAGTGIKLKPDLGASYRFAGPAWIGAAYDTDPALHFRDRIRVRFSLTF